MGCNDFLITIKCDDVHATTYWNDIQDKPDVATKDEIITDFKTINGQEITGTGNIEINSDVDTSNFVTKSEMSNYPNKNSNETINARWNFQRGILEYGTSLNGRYMSIDEPFKTINGESIKGDGNIEISSNIDTSNFVTRNEMSNYPNKNRNETINAQWYFDDGIYEYGSLLSDRYMSTSQQFKTINGETILGEGDIAISGGSGGSGTSLEVVNGSGFSIAFATKHQYSELQTSGTIDSQCLYVITD